MTLPQLAKLTVETYVKEREIISPPRGLPEEFLNKKAGTFVTIEKQGQLRGCIGTYLPTRDNIAEETIHNAIAASTEDYRFGPVKKEELPHLSYTVYILNEPELIKNIKELNPKKYGIIVKTMPIVSATAKDVVFDGVVPYKSGLLLPDLEGIDTVEEQVSIACQKGGINPEKEKILIYRFTVEKHVQQ
jgi:AmmeMemoRadiSam system protein A